MRIMQLQPTPVSLLLVLLALGATVVPLALRAAVRRRARYWRRLEDAYARYEATAP